MLTCSSLIFPDVLPIDYTKIITYYVQFLLSVQWWDWLIICCHISMCEASHCMTGIYWIINYRYFIYFILKSLNKCHISNLPHDFMFISLSPLFATPLQHLHAYIFHFIFQKGFEKATLPAFIIVFETASKFQCELTNVQALEAALCSMSSSQASAG